MIPATASQNEPPKLKKCLVIGEMLIKKNVEANIYTIWLYYIINDLNFKTSNY